MSRNLYDILGVPRTASGDDIRRAYKLKAKALHPDLHPNDDAKSNEFKAVSSAYEILGDAEKRKLYDLGQIDGDGNPKGFAGGPAGPGSNMGGGFRGAQGDPFEDLLSGIFGGTRRRPGPRKGQDVRYRVDVAFEDAVLGAKRDMMMADGRTMSIAIPAGVETGQTLRLKSQGRPSASGGPPGDALIEVTVRESDVWTRKGDDLKMAMRVPLRTAILGGVVDVLTPAGTVSLKVPEGSNTGATLRLRGKGVQIPDKPGNLYVRLEVEIEDPKDSGLRKWAKGG